MFENEAANETEPTNCRSDPFICAAADSVLAGQEAKAASPDAQTKIVVAQATFGTDVQTVHSGTLQPPSFQRFDALKGGRLERYMYIGYVTAPKQPH